MGLNPEFWYPCSPEAGKEHMDHSTPRADLWGMDGGGTVNTRAVKRNGEEAEAEP